MILYLKSKNNSFNAIGDYDIENKKFIVKKGSIVSTTIAKSATFRASKRIENQRKDIVENNKTVEDVIFKSSSTAANFVTGRSTNGLIAWKDKDGKKLKDLLKNE